MIEHFRTVNAKLLFPIFILLLSQSASSGYTLSINIAMTYPTRIESFSRNCAERRPGRFGTKASRSMHIFQRFRAKATGEPAVALM
jgi:hypothetical protein